MQDGRDNQQASSDLMFFRGALANLSHSRRAEEYMPPVVHLVSPHLTVERRGPAVISYCADHPAVFHLICRSIYHTNVECRRPAS